ENEERDTERLLHLMRNPSKFTLKQRTNFTEAALIKYFKPEYNSIYKNNFPDRNHNTYTECYDLDVNMVSVEINIETSLYTKCVPTSNEHVARNNFQNSNDRRKMFEDLD